ncbi:MULTISPECIES: polya polymerase [unclassified Eubacterium (in: firmicutes)]|uniref:polya polymerase n=1 Tax=unclassified Eubacterium (in: firmicutes) TaxID=2624479 RepID=UPI0012AF08FE|nr:MULTISPECIES: polya polymerase [unclassified Eubacterium (in: firmicutes)]
MSIKVLNIKDYEGFFKMVESCSGTVELVTSQGDRLNLKSQLTQYIAFTGIFKNSDSIEMQIETSDKEDLKKLMYYIIHE